MIFPTGSEQNQKIRFPTVRKGQRGLISPCRGCTNLHTADCWEVNCTLMSFSFRMDQLRIFQSARLLSWADILLRCWLCKGGARYAILTRSLSCMSTFKHPEHNPDQYTDLISNKIMNWFYPRANHVPKLEDLINCVGSISSVLQALQAHSARFILACSVLYCF